MMLDVWLRVVTPTAVFALRFDDSLLVEAARYYYGIRGRPNTRDARSIVKFLRARGFQVDALR